MDFGFTEEQTQARDNVIRFADRELNKVFNTDDGQEFPRDVWMLAADLGLLGLVVSEEYGGAGLDCVSAANILDALGFGCLDHGFAHAICTQNLCAIHIEEYGTDQQKSEALPKLCSGEWIAAQAITEPDAGSDVGAIKTSAVANGDGYRLNGSKVFITNGPIADVVIVYAVTDPSKTVLGRTSCFLLTLDTPGIERGSAFEKMGLHTMKNGELFFTDCDIPNTALIGRAGTANAMFAAGMNWERILLFATFVGKLERVINRCVEYVRERKQFGAPIGTYQAVANKIVDMRVNLELARLAVFKAAWLIDNKKPAALNAAIAKLFSSESVKAACLDAVQIHGGYGFMAETGIERELRDSIAGTIYSGTSEIQKNIIAKLCGV